jgi:hypothetical protein
VQGQKQGPAQGFAADFLGRMAGLVDDMAALLSASALQLLGGCRGVATAWAALQASGVFLNGCHCATCVSSWATAAERQRLQCTTAGSSTVLACPELSTPCVKRVQGMLPAQRCESCHARLPASELSLQESVS